MSQLRLKEVSIVVRFQPVMSVLFPQGTVERKKEVRLTLVRVLEQRQMVQGEPQLSVCC